MHILSLSTFYYYQDMVFANPVRTITEKEADEMKLRYYDSQVHRAAFVLPRFAKLVRVVCARVNSY